MDVMDTFLTVGKCGSFSKAADALFLTPNGVKKRMNQLEADTGIRLFERTNRGIRLTAAGQSFYEDCQHIRTDYAMAVKKALALQENTSHGIRFGLMATFAQSFLVADWNGIRMAENMGHNQLIYYGNGTEDYRQMLRDVGYRSDIAVDIFDEAVAGQYHLSAIRVSAYAILLGVPKWEAGGRETGPASLHGRRVGLLKKGRATCMDAVWEQLPEDCEPLPLEEYSAISVNACFESGACVFLPENMTSMYPFYAFSAVPGLPKMEFGLYFASREPASVSQFLARF